jgi:vacuolar-type H+-ATPase subunit E/Vma4
MSEKTLDKLIATLKSEAIDAADTEAKKIVDKAQAEADKLISDAQSQKERILSEAKNEAEQRLEKGTAALQQAARDLKVSVRNDLLEMLKEVLTREVEAAIDPELLEKAILKVAENTGTELELHLPENMDAELLGKIQKSLQESEYISQWIQDGQLLKGFSLSKTDQGWRYDITPEELSELLFEQLSQSWVNILSENQEK